MMAELVIILGLIVLNGLFAMAEIALISVRKARLEIQANKGDLKAKSALDLASHPDTFLSTIQIGITLMGILTGIFSGEHLQDNIITFLNRFEWLKNHSHSVATAIVVVLVTFLSLVGELVAKRIGLSKPEAIAKIVAGPMRLVTYITR